jgi:hypothetical protein
MDPAVDNPVSTVLFDHLEGKALMVAWGYDRVLPQ